MLGEECSVVVTAAGEVRYRDSFERVATGRLADDARLIELVGRVRDWLQRLKDDEQFDRGDLRFFGALLFDFLFPVGAATTDAIRQMLAVVGKRGLPLRFSLTFDGASDAATLPWELMVLPCSDGPRLLCSHPPDNKRPSWIARRLREPQDGAPAYDAPARPRVLLVVASVPGGPTLAAGATLEALRRLDEQRLIELDELGGEPTLAGLERRLQGATPPHVVHLIAHGDPRHVQLFRDATERRRLGDAHHVRPDDLMAAIGNHRPGLVYLDACRVAEDGAASPFVRALLDAQVPAVLAMQYAITNADAQAFGARFYQTAFQDPLDVAVNRARQELLGRRRFAAPVLYVGGVPGLRLAAERTGLVACPSPICRATGRKILFDDPLCTACGAAVEPCPQGCGALIEKGARACGACRKPTTPQAADVAPPRGFS